MTSDNPAPDARLKEFYRMYIFYILFDRPSDFD